MSVLLALTELGVCFSRGLGHLFQKADLQVSESLNAWDEMTGRRGYVAKPRSPYRLEGNHTALNHLVAEPAATAIRMSYFSGQELRQCSRFDLK